MVCEEIHYKNVAYDPLGHSKKEQRFFIFLNSISCDPDQEINNNKWSPHPAIAICFYVYFQFRKGTFYSNMFLCLFPVQKRQVLFQCYSRKVGLCPVSAYYEINQLIHQKAIFFRDQFLAKRIIYIFLYICYFAKVVNYNGDLNPLDPIILSSMSKFKPPVMLLFRFQLEFIF